MILLILLYQNCLYQKHHLKLFLMPVKVLIFSKKDKRLAVVVGLALYMIQMLQRQSSQERKSKRALIDNNKYILRN